MNGISSMISKASFPVHNFGTNNKISFGTSRKIDLIPCQLPNLHLQRVSPFEATKPVLKHLVCSASAFKDGSGFEVPEVNTAAVPYVLLSTATIGKALIKTWEAARPYVFLNPNVWYYIFIGVAAAIVARVFLGNIMSGFEVVRNYRSFEPGDLLQAGQLEGHLLQMGLLTTSLLTPEYQRKIFIATPWLNGQEILINSEDPSYAMASEITLNIDKIEKIDEISEEITNMMRANSIIYLDEEQPYCYISEVKPQSFKVKIGCNLKQVGEKEVSVKENDILMESVKIIRKNGATLGEHVRG